jgi:predicted site-specific integrase-resolvase
MTAREVQDILGINKVTLSRYVNGWHNKQNDKYYPPIIRASRIRCNRLVYNDEDVYQLAGKPRNRVNDVVVYARVDKWGMGKDAAISLLDEQVERLTKWCTVNGLTVTRVFRELAPSTTSRKDRKMLYSMLDMVTKDKVGQVVIDSPDRLLNFGWEGLDIVMRSQRVRLTYLIQDVAGTRYPKEIVRGIKVAIGNLTAAMSGTNPLGPGEDFKDDDLERLDYEYNSGMLEFDLIGNGVLEPDQIKNSEVVMEL